MNTFLFGRHSWPFVLLGGLLAAACLVSTWYINRLQADLARAVRHDAARMEAADELQVQLRHLRFHSVVCAADPAPVRRAVVDADTAQADAALAAIRADITADDEPLLAAIETGYAEYKRRLGPDGQPPPAADMADLVRWSDAHPMRDLLQPCRDLSDRQRTRMDAGLVRSEEQSAWAGRLLLGLGLVGAFGGLVIGYATARGQSRRAARLSVRVRAVQSRLDQEVGAVTVERPAGSLDEQLDRVVERVTDVCRRLQEQERDLLRAEQLAAVGQLAAGVAHEVRNPLTGIKFLIECALRGTNPVPLTDEDLRLISREVVRIERTVQGLLDFARMPPPDRRPHDLRALVTDAVALARGRAEQKGVTLAADLPADAVPVSADRDQMLSLLTNLLFNAIDATPPGGAVGACVAAGPGGILTVAVTDTGPGIAPAVAARLFTPFATTKPTGTGLGLTVARRVARDHGGTLTAANRPDGGAVFTLTLGRDEG
jgi:signal transduction histidine kinase